MAIRSILIVENEPRLGELVRVHLLDHGFEARIAQTGQAALDETQSNRFDLIVLDLSLPDTAGLEVCRQLRLNPQTSGIPILIVSARGNEEEIVAAIELGADDYVIRPFSPKVLIARVDSILRHHARTTKQIAVNGDRPSSTIILAGGSLVIDAGRSAVIVHGRPVELTETEFGIIDYLASQSGLVRTRNQIIAVLRGTSVALSTRSIDVHLTGLRRKLGTLGSMIETVRGIGYRLSELTPAAGD